MKNFVGVMLILAAIAGCASSRNDQTERSGSSNSGAKVDQDMVVRQAVIDAFKLEHQLSTGNIQSRDAVLSLFRKGFHQELAEKLSKYYWLEDASGGMIRATEPLFSVPEKIEIVKRQGDRVITEIRKEGNETGPNVWPDHILEVVMKKEGTVWKILSILPKTAGASEL